MYSKEFTRCSSNRSVFRLSIRWVVVIVVITILSGSGLLAFAQIFTSATYYVSPTGSDQNPGSITQPWQTIQKAATTMVGGDTVYIRGGTYNEQVSLLYRYNTTGPFITFINYPGESVILDGTGIAIEHGYGLFHIQKTDYIRVSGLKVQHSNGAGIEVFYANNIKIDNNLTYDTVKSGISVWGGTNVVVDGNDIALACNSHLNYPASEENISIATGSYNIEVKNNYVHQAANIPDGYSGGEGINIKDGAHDVKVHHNVVHLDERTDGKPSNRLAYGLDAWSNETYNVSFYDNVAYNNGAAFVVESEAGATAHDIFVYNNIAYNNGAGFYIPNWALNESSLKKNIHFINNTSYKNKIGIFINSVKIENIVIRNNIFYLNDTQILVGTGVPQLQIVSDHNFISGDPKFVNPAGGDFHLLSGSPVIDTGSSLNAPNIDFDENPRPQGTGHDMGAYEFGSTAIPAPTRTFTPAQPSPTSTSLPASATAIKTSTPIPPTATFTQTNVPTNTHVPPTATGLPTFTKIPTYTATATASQPSAANSKSTIYQVGVSPNNKYAGGTDTLLLQASPSTNFGSASSINIGGLAGSEKVALIKWDLSDMSVLKKVITVSFGVNLSGAKGQTYQLYQCLRSWDQAQATWNVASNGINWQVPGAKGVNDRGSIVLGTLSPTADGTYVISLNKNGIEVVQNWILRSSPNYGFVLAGSSGTEDIQFASNEHPTPSNHPRLVIKTTGK